MELCPRFYGRRRNLFFRLCVVKYRKIPFDIYGTVNIIEERHEIVKNKVNEREFYYLTNQISTNTLN